ncbi:LLM class flavin-dependent oxidoreductase [Enemella evansiae]|uniref:LLM class flavin-dependent oxidoreductase n=1 Tax=Enemella evansiae TaxID=2016499 RepID=UPI000B96B254|nr:LLM class flavin-dependent oxidoreductase [Enemella evansiae]OYO05459.1 N5,N10-methylene tetrahydromethanopterin reductase [Enemella evansiae]
MSTPDLPSLALVAPPDLPPEQIIRVAQTAESGGIDELWFWEDCFASSGLGPAAAALAATARIKVGIGLLPVPLRAPTLTAMEIATLARMFPGRFRPGLGHGVRDWMKQAGVAVGSPLTLLREHTTTINALLAGETVTYAGRYVALDEVRLRWPPEELPGLLVGGRGPKTLALAGELSAGAILDDVAPAGVPDLDRMRDAVETVRAARREAGRQGSPEIVAILPVPGGTSTDELRDRLAALGSAGATTVTAVAEFVDGPPAGDDRVFALAEQLAEIGGK